MYLDFGQSLEIHLGGSASPTFRYNAHPPAAVLIALPFGLLDYPSAYVAWSAVSLVCLGISLWLLVGPGRDRQSGRAGICLLTLVVSGNSLTHQIVQGQLNLLLLALIVGAWWADRKDWPAISGALIGVAAAVKLFPAFLIVFHLAQRRWRAVWGSAIAFLLVNASGCLVLGFEAYRDYFWRVAPDVAKFRDTWPNSSLLGFWSKLFDGVSGHVVPLSPSPAIAQALTALSCLAVLASSVWAVPRIAPASGSDFAPGSNRDLAFGLCCTGMLLASPITWDHAFLLLVPAFWFAWQACRGQFATRVLIVVLATVLLWVNPVTVWRLAVPDQFGATGHPRLADPACVLTFVSFQFYALLGIYLLILAQLARPVWASRQGGPSGGT